MLSKLQSVKSLNCLVGKVYARMPLKYVLIVPFILQICGAVGLVGYLSYQNGQKAVRELASQLENEICDRIEQHLNNYLTTPKQINQINLDAVELGMLNLSDFKTTGNYFWKQMQVFNVGYNSFANPKGEFIGIERLDDGKLLINEVSQKYGIGKLYIYDSDLKGNRRQLQQVKDYDPRTEAWYSDAVKAGKPVWSQIYQWEDKPEVLSISSSYPVYDKTRKLVGVISVDLILSQISNFLTKLNTDQSGKAFILERSGLIVASSTEPPYSIINGQIKRRSALESRNSLIRLTTQSLIKRFGSLGFVVGKQQLTFSADGMRYFVQVKSWKDELGLDWLIVAVIPEGEFMEQINENTRITILLCIVAFLVATRIGILTARWVIKPILQLNTSAKKIAQGEWEQTPEIQRSDELGELAKSFETMAKQLQASFSVLEAKNAQMQVLNEALSESQSRLTKFLEAMPVGVFIIDAEGEPYYTNHIGQQILGQGAIAEVSSEQLSEVYQAYLAGTDQLYPSDRLPILRALLGESTRIDDMEVRHFDKIIPVEVLGKPIYDESGNLAFAMATFFDITQRKQAENLLAEYNRTLEAQVKKRTEEFQQVIEQLQTTQEELIQSQKIAAQEQQAAIREAARSAAANLAKSEFLANMSHELRTPLNAILGFTQVMSRDYSLSSEHQENLAIINRAGEHLLNLINDILEMSKIEAGRITLNRSSFDLIHLLNNLEEMLYLRAASKSLQIVFEYAHDIPQYIETDENKLFQVLLNLLGNAIKFTDIGRVTLRLRWEQEEENLSCNPRLFFEVQDTGCGITPQEIGLLFEAFEQTEIGRKSQQGTGLGLAISRKYVQLMGGDITVSSTPGMGSTFAFDIQIALACPREMPITQIKSQILSLAPSEKAYRILVVDDAKESRLLLVKILTSLGFEVREATNGLEAVSNWESWQPNLIFMDMRMPIMDGYEATRIIKGKQVGHGTANRLRRFPKFKQLTSSGSQYLNGGLTDSGEREILKTIYKAYPTPEVASVTEHNRDASDGAILRSPKALAACFDFLETEQSCLNKHTIVIALTASAFEEERQKILSIGCDDFIRKPFTQEVLLEKLSQHLGVKYTNQIENLNTAVAEQATQIFVSFAELLSHLSQMSPEWLQKIHYAAASCSDELILELIKQIPSDNVQVSQVLRDLANNYQFEKIMELTRTNVE
ncbi:response regulator [Nostoc sp. UCD121]|uniref:ATP-binding protein n=1 Tax=unclassified Nostoc TaxID=2593658 RepID=UPI00162A4DB0|nr:MULTISPECIES: ATP-binding protein [unclassified Nostoc]MBC1219603.1 response regulator [Nostoc sp. UCD120]MBC1279162.1 response regulator [Nostoc sp. UCD121]MBC1298078.1 response regulator [Nostoc sp. UCD122]